MVHGTYVEATVSWLCCVSATRLTSCTAGAGASEDCRDDYKHMCIIYVLYKPWLLGLFHKYTTRDRGQRKFRGSLRLITPEPEGRGRYQPQTSDDRDRGSYICGIDRKTMVHIVYSMIDA